MVPIEANAVKVFVTVLRTFNELTFIVLAWALFKKARFVAERSCVRKESVLIFIVLRAGAVREFVREITEPPRRTVLIAKLLRFVVLTQGAVREFVRAIVEPITEFVLIVFVLTLFAYTLLVLIFMVLVHGVVIEFTKEIALPPRIDVLMTKVLRFVVLTPGTVRVFDKLIVEPISEDTTRLVALISLARIKFVLISLACNERSIKAVLVKKELV